jgi:hypothetical protein
MMHAPELWRAVSAARLPSGGLSALASVRDQKDVRVLRAGEVAWVRWPEGQSEVVQCLLPVHGIEFFIQSAGLWFRFGHSVPTNDAPPPGEGVSVAAILAPNRFEPLPPTEQTWSPIVLTVVRGGELKSTAAIVCTISELLKWADRATTAELATVRAAHCGERAVLLGKQLPTIPTALRYWGKQVLMPLGFRAEPDLPEAALRGAVGVSEDELLVLNETRAEVIPLAAFESPTRAGVRLGAQTA